MRVGSILGIDITVNLSWLFVFAFVAWSFTNPTGLLRMPDLSATERLVLGIVASLLFFASVLVHELAHSLVARRRGIPVRGITLFIFGGVSAIEGEPATAPAEAWISGVGPLTSLILGALFWAVAQPLGGALSPFGAIALYLGFANVALAVFNILPAYPLDGGRVLHALLWKLTSDRDRATKITVLLGRILATLLFAFGIVEALTIDFGAGLWTTFIAWFLLQAGTFEQSRVTIARALDGHLARELAAPADARLPANATGTEALAYLRSHNMRAVPVFVGDSFLGVLTIDELAQTPAAELERSYVTSLMTRADEVKSLSATTSASDAVRDFAAANERAYALAGERGEFAGLLTRESVTQWLANVSSPKAS